MLPSIFVSTFLTISADGIKNAYLVNSEFGGPFKDWNWIVFSPIHFEGQTSTLQEKYFKRSPFQCQILFRLKLFMYQKKNHYNVKSLGMLPT